MSSAATVTVAVAEIEGRGRSLVSTQPLKAGQIVLKDSPILLYSALPLINSSSSASSTYCHHCFRRTTLHSSPSTCSSCSAAFCSPKCFQAATSSSHSPYVCQALAHLLRNCSGALSNLPLERQVQARFLIAAYNLALVHHTQFQVLLSLQGTVTDNDASAAHYLSSLCLPPPSTPAPSLELTASLLAKDRLNAFGLMEPFVDGQDGRRSVRAYGIYPMASFFNHDCLPNACRFDYVDTASTEENNIDIVVRMIHDVPQGREICLSYFPVNLDYSSRQKRLLEDYGFVCKCDRCKVEANWSDHDNDDDNESDEQVMDEGDDEDEQVMASEDAEVGGGADFPHAYFFLRYMCNRENCWGTLAPLPPPSDGTPSTVMECNVCGNLKNDAIGGEDADGMDD